MNIQKAYVNLIDTIEQSIIDNSYYDNNNIYCFCDYLLEKKYVILGIHLIVYNGIEETFIKFRLQKYYLRQLIAENVKEFMLKEMLFMYSDKDLEALQVLKNMKIDKMIYKTTYPNFHEIQTVFKHFFFVDMEKIK